MLGIGVVELVILGAILCMLAGSLAVVVAIVLAMKKER
mgnify:CR=1 FL=1